ncbi:YgdB family protein [Cronobacter muytjensii]
MSTISMVLSFLLLGSLLLSGLQQQLDSRFGRAANENAAIRAFNESLSALALSQHRHWQFTPQWQCQRLPEVNGRACVRQTETHVLVAAQGTQENTAPITLWRWAQADGEILHFTAHGWSDFCPLTEAKQCQLP